MTNGDQHNRNRFLNLAMTAQAKDVAIVVTERYRFPSRFDRRYIEQIAMPGSSLHDSLRSLPGFRADQYTHWNFVAFTLDPEAKRLFGFDMARREILHGRCFQGGRWSLHPARGEVHGE